MVKTKKLKFIDLFAGLGGFHMAMNNLGHECVFASELQENLRKLYTTNYDDVEPENVVGDIHNIASQDIPAHDILCAGFPCQPFSQAGKQKGLDDPVNGNHFHKIVEILKFHKPKYILLENVPNLSNHDEGRTWKIIKEALESEDLGYKISDKILSPHQFGIPQHRKRLYIVGVLGGKKKFDFDLGEFDTGIDVYSILKESPEEYDSIPLKDATKKHIGVWQDFLDNIEDPKKVPRFPVWSPEFGATYPYKYVATTKSPIKDFEGKKGSFGKDIKGNTIEAIIPQLPKYARTDQEIFPPWKVTYIKSNRLFYDENKKWIDKWKKKVIKRELSHQKFEWNCGIIPLEIKGKIIQFRPSGVRIKKLDFSLKLAS